MNEETIRRLLAINQQFYQSFASSFSSTRYSVQPGVKQALREVLAGYADSPSVLHMLDIGCGNGSLARWLGANGYQINYTGLDASSGLIACCPHESPATLKVTFDVADISQPGWEAGYPQNSYRVVTCFAVMHHIPGNLQRDAIYSAIRSLLATGGVFIQSNWQFMNSPRLAARVLGWDQAGMHPASVEAGDYLLDWRAENDRLGLRYVHLFSAEELNAHASASGFTPASSFDADGKEGNLARYDIWHA